MSSSGARPCVALALALLLGRATSLEAQQRLFPQVPSFELPEASPRVHGLVGRLLSARHGDSRFGNEGEAEVALGENVLVLALQQGQRPITLGFGSQVYARFSLSDSTRHGWTGPGRWRSGGRAMPAAPGDSRGDSVTPSATGSVSDAPVARSGWTFGRASPADCWGVGCTLSWGSSSTRMRRPRGGSAPRPRSGSAWRRGPEVRRSGSR